MYQQRKVIYKFSFFRYYDNKKPSTNIYINLPFLVLFSPANEKRFVSKKVNGEESKTKRYLRAREKKSLH